MATTVTSTAPLPAGSVATSSVEEMKVTRSAGVAPKKTWLSGVKPVPVMVIASPPSADPVTGAMLVSVGAGA